MAVASFTVTRSQQSMIRPFSAATPSAGSTTTLPLSVIDRVPGLRHLVNSLHVFTHGDHGVAKVIREALSKALDHYYPFAGRLLGSPDDVRLECTGEGAWFVEAAADCSLEDVNYLNGRPLMIAHSDLLPHGPGSCPELDIPFMMQVTEFTCGGFVVGILSVHTIADGLGAAQFVSAIAEMARGLSHPTVEPVWCRELMPKPPTVVRHPAAMKSPPVALNLQYSTMDIPSENINCIKRKYFDLTGQQCSAFDVCIAHAWRSRTRAIHLADPDAPVHLCFFASVRHLLNKVLPPGGGYYGNCFFPVAVTTSSGWVKQAELLEVVKLIRDAKARLPEDFTRWASGAAAEAGYDPYDLTFTYDSLFVSDWTRLGFGEVDYGWGIPAHIIPFGYNDFMAVVIIGSPALPKKGSRLMTQCVTKDHLADFRHQIMSKLD